MKARCAYVVGVLVSLILSAAAASAGPVLLPSLKLWLAADLGVTLDGSGRVEAWADQSGNGNDFSQASAAARPQFVGGGGPFGTDLISFDGNDDVLRNAAQIVGGTSFTIFTVMSVLEPGYPWALGETISHRMFYEGHPGGGVTNTNFFDVGHDGNDARAMLLGIGDPTTKILTITGSGTPANVQVFANGVTATMSPTGAIVPTDFSLGNTLGFAHTTPNPFTLVNWLEFVVYDTNLGTADRLAVEKYLHDKYIAPPVPEPVSSALMAAGLLASLVYAARRKKRTA